MKGQKWVKRILCAVVMMATALLPTTATFARLTEQQQQLYASNQIMLYERGNKCVSTSTITTRGNSNGSDVYIIGDSISTDTYAGGAIRNALPGAEINAVGSSWFSADAAGRPESGVKRLKDTISILDERDILVFAMGTNGGITDSYIQALFETIAGKNVKVILMTIYYANHLDDTQMENSNQVVRNTAEQYPNVTYFDWYSAAASDPDKYVIENFHTSNPDGNEKFAALMKEAVDAVTTLKTNALDAESATFYSTYSEKWGDTTNLDHWDGTCGGVSGYESFLANRVEMLIQVGAETGVPWESLAAQAIQESQGEISPVARNCNNPLGIAGTSCDNYYSRFSSFEDAYRAYATTNVVREVLEAGNFASSPYSLTEYIQYGGVYSYAVCGWDSNLYPQCKGYEGKPTPGYVSGVSKLLCGIQHWAVENGYPISEENYTNYESPYREIYDDDSGATFRTLSQGGFMTYCSNDESAIVYTGEPVFYSQSDPRWANITYGACSDGATIAAAGCGPTALASIIATLTGDKNVTPDVIAEQAAGKYRVCGQGSSHAIAELAAGYGLEVQDYGVLTINEISNYLRQGVMFQVAGSGPNPFSEGGHFIGVRGITSSGKWLIFDSAHDSTDNNTREWDPSEIYPYVRSEWWGVSNPNRPIEPLYSDSTDIVCDPRTTDIGEYTGWRSGSSFPIRLCALDQAGYQIKSNGEESSGNWGVNYNGGYAIVNSRVSGAFATLAHKYYLSDENGRSGNVIVADSAYRSYEHQKYLYQCYVNKNCNGGNLAAQEGTSNHEAGLAIDFHTGCAYGSGPGACGNAMDKWLSANVDNGLTRSVSSEAWHVSPGG